MTSTKSVNQKIVRLSDVIIPKYYSTFNDTSYAHKIFTSGRAGTKSSRGALRAVYKIVSDDDCAVVIIRKFHNKLRKTVYKEVLRAIRRLELDKTDFKITASPMEIKYLPNGNTIYFTGSDSIDDTKGMIDEEKPIKLVEVDEVTEFFDKGEGEDELMNIEATFVRGNDEEFCMEYYFNPPKNQKAPVMIWLDKMKQRGDAIHIHTDYRDVPVKWLGQKLINSALELLKNDEKLYRWLWLGECTGLDDVIYYMFNPEKHVADATPAQLQHITISGIGVDYGQMNATTFQAFGLDYVDRCVRGLGEYYHSGRDTGQQRSPSEYAKDFKDFKARIEDKLGKPITFVFIDPSAKGLAEEIKRVCPEVVIKNPDNTVNLGIDRVKKLLSYLRLFICTEQRHLNDEMYLYMWDMDSVDKGVEKPVKTNDHCQDALRYFVMGVWQYIRQMLPMITEED